MKKVSTAILLIALATLFLCHAIGDEAQDITRACTITAEQKLQKGKSELYDRKYFTNIAIRPQKTIDIDSRGQEISGLYLQYADDPVATDIEILKDGTWQKYAHCGRFLSDWVSLPANTTQVRLVNRAATKLKMAQLTVYGAGDRPSCAPSWVELNDCDMMLLVGHPDDELLWFGGLLATYGGERKLNVQVVYCIRTSAQRKLQLLDGLHTCGINAYPILLGMWDVKPDTLHALYLNWGRKIYYGKLTQVIRKYKPEVMVTHAINGEYGHPAHMACAEAAPKCVTYAAAASEFPQSVAAYGTWQVQKLYLHKYKDKQITMDWHVPLESFGGEDSLSVGTRALECHKSQVGGRWNMNTGVKYQNNVFGLFYTTVGDDVACNDLMEHVVLNKNSDSQFLDDTVQEDET